MKRLAFLLMLGLGVDAQACMFDTDCEVGSRCLKRWGDLYGVCAGGLDPGRPPWSDVRDPLALDESYGERCRFDLDCGTGFRCLKDRAALDGVCVTRDLFREILFEPGAGARPRRQSGGRPCHSRFECAPGEVCLAPRPFAPGRCVSSR